MDGGRYNFPTEPKPHPDAVVQGGSDGQYYRFTILTDRLVRYEWSPDGRFEDRASTLAIRRLFEVPKFRTAEIDGRLEIITDFFRLAYDKGEFRPEGLTVTVGGDTWRYDGENYGDLGGTARTLDTSDGRIALGPGVLSRKPYAVIDDSKSMLFSDSGWVASREPNRKDGYVFAYNGDHKAAIKAFYHLTGAQPVLPRWALGNWWSRYHAYSAADYLSLVDRFSDKDIPLTVAVLDMDWHWVDVPAKYGSGWTGYSWNRELFPDPPKFLQKLRSRGLKATLNDHPADGIRAFEDQYEAVAKAMGFDTSHRDPIEFDSTNKRFFDAYFDVLKYNLEEQGVDFWWVDWQQGNTSRIPGLDPLWMLNHYHYLTSRRRLERLQEPIGFSRYAGPGSHRYPIGFSGDTIISWASLNFQPEFTATASNIGYGWWSHDIGGHYWGTRSNALTVRWVQLGCFSPILRLHSEKSQWNSKEPWKYERGASEIMKKFLTFRHRLIPFLYAMNVRASKEGEPLVQPMYWNHSDEEEAYSVPNQYYFGPNLIVAPITSPQSSTTLLGGVRAWLPPGRYVDIFRSGLVYDGGRHIQLHRTLESIPVLAREGTIIPLDNSEASPNRHGAKIPTHIEILLVVGRDAVFDLVEEDENSPGSFTCVRIKWDQQKGKLTMAPASETPPRPRVWAVTLIGYSNYETPLGICLQPRRFGLRNDDRRLGKFNGTVTKEFDFGPNPQLNVVDVPARLHGMLYRCESGYQMKETIWKLVTEDSRPLHVRMAELYQLDIDTALRDAVIEIWLADERSQKKDQTDDNTSRHPPTPHDPQAWHRNSEDYVFV